MAETKQQHTHDRFPVESTVARGPGIPRITDKSWFLAILLVTFVAYIPALRGGFVFDDDVLITDNSLIHASNGLHRIWFTAEAQDYYPLTESLWWLEWRAWGRHAAGYHVVNVLLHAANAVLVWLVLQRLKVRGAWLAGLVFAIHPVNAATVAWISEQKNTLSMLFYLVAILLYLRFDEERRWGWYGLSLAAFALALLSKTAVVMLPVVLLGCAWWMRGRVTGKDLLRSVPFFALSLVLGLATMWYQYHVARGEPVAGTNGFAFRLAAAGRAPWFFLGKALWPVNLTAIYPKWQIDASRWSSYLPGAALAACFLVFWWKRRTWGRPLLFGLGYFVVMLFPVLGLLKQGPYRLTSIADHWDHWQYYSIVGVVALVVAAAETGRRAGQPSRFVRGVAGLAVLLMLAAATWTRAGVYASAETLWRDTLARNSTAWLAHANLGVALAQTGKIEEAIAHYEQALQIKPDYAEAHNNLGAALARTGHIDEAITQFEQALRLKPDYAEAHHNLGIALAQVGRTPEAMAQFEQALRLKPDYAEAHCDLGIRLGEAGRMPKAIEHLEQALRLNPDYAEAHYNLGIALARQGKIEEAIAHYELALRLKPDYAEADSNLGVVLAQTGKIEEAIAHFEQALRLKPDYAEAHYNLGIALEQAGKTREAIGHYQQALRINPDFTQAQIALARLRPRQ